MKFRRTVYAVPIVMAVLLSSSAHAGSKTEAVEAVVRWLRNSTKEVAVPVAKEVAVPIASDLLKDELISHVRNENSNGNSIAPQYAQPTIPPPAVIKGRWFVMGVQYDGVLVMQGNHGSMRIWQSNGGPIIDQDMMLLQSVPNQVLYVGSNPRYAGTITPTLYYPDTFQMTQTSESNWHVMMCDTINICAPVHLMR